MIGLVCDQTIFLYHLVSVYKPYPLYEQHHPYSQIRRRKQRIFHRWQTCLGAYGVSWIVFNKSAIRVSSAPPIFGWDVVDAEGFGDVCGEYSPASCSKKLRSFGALSHRHGVSCRGLADVRNYRQGDGGGAGEVLFLRG